MRLSTVSRNGLRAEVVVIGGGVIGTSVAYHLAADKVKVVLLEKNDLASGASGACDGLVFLQSKKPGVHLELALRSKERFEALAEALPVDIEYANNGGMVVIESESEIPAMRTFVTRQKKIGLDVELLDARLARELEPALSKNIAGATYSPLDGQVNPIALTHGLAIKAKALGAKILTGARVLNIHLQGDRVHGVETNEGTIQTDSVVNAAGIFAPEIGRILGFDIPITPRRGQILVTEKMPSMLKTTIISAKYIAAKFDPHQAKIGGGGVSIEQTANGNFLLGSTREFVGFDRRTSLKAIRSIAERTGRLIPGLKSMNVIRSFAGLRPYTPDGLPILGQVPGVKGFYMAAGHEGDGIALAPVTGQLIAQLVTTGASDIPLHDFHLKRFAIPNSLLRGGDEPQAPHKDH